MENVFLAITITNHRFISTNQLLMNIFMFSYKYFWYRTFCHQLSYLCPSGPPPSVHLLLTPAPICSVLQQRWLEMQMRVVGGGLKMKIEIEISRLKESSGGRGR